MLFKKGIRWPMSPDCIAGTGFSLIVGVGEFFIEFLVVTLPLAK